MTILRVCKSIVCLLLAVFALLVCLNNLADYDSNYAFVQHTLSMDTVFPSNTLKYRAILDPFVWSLAYGLIIFAEFLTGVLLLIGAIGLLKNIHSPLAFNEAKNWIYLGCLVGFFTVVLWFYCYWWRMVLYVAIRAVEWYRGSLSFRCHHHVYIAIYRNA